MKKIVGFCMPIFILCAFPSLLWASHRYMVYRVRRGDSLYIIAQKYHTSVKGLASINKLRSPYIILRGQRLKIPISRGVYRLYKVKRGDTLKKVAQRYGVKWRRLASMNGIKPPYTIYRDQYLKVPLNTRRKGAVPKRLATKRSRHHPPKAFFPPVSAAGRVLKGMNMGLNYALSKGGEVFPSSPGRVVYSSLDMRGLGSVLILEHPGGYETVYAGKGIYWLVGEGEDVDRRATLGEAVDNTTLHFEIRRRGKPLPAYKLVRGKRGRSK